MYDVDVQLTQCALLEIFRSYQILKRPTPQSNLTQLHRKCTLAQIGI